MKGAVMGPQSLDELEQMIRSKFHSVNNAGLCPAEFTGASPGPVAQAVQGKHALIYMAAGLLCCHHLPLKSRNMQQP